MTKKYEIYKCSVCGNIVEVVHASKGELVCCGQPMVLMTEKQEDVGNEKHLPVVENKDGKVTVNVGSIEHPMAEEHYIEWIEVMTNNKVYKKYLSPEQKPVATFEVDEEVVKVREYCNIHGLWSVE